MRRVFSKDLGSADGFDIVIRNKNCRVLNKNK